MSKKWWRVAVVFVMTTATVYAAEVGLITSVSGSVKLQDDKSAVSELKSFVKVRQGDLLVMEGTSRLQVVYFDSGRQETWLGAGSIQVGAKESTLKVGKPQSEIKTLPPVLVKQLSKTPSTDGNVKAGMVRMRSMTSPGAVEAAEKTYAEMRAKADTGDRNPELYLLASYFEMREFDKLNTLLAQMNAKAPDSSEMAALNALYARAVAEAKSAAK